MKVMERFEERMKTHRAWLKENHPETFTEQKHTEEGTPERAYWHHGYMMAIRDILAACNRKKAGTNETD